MFKKIVFGVGRWLTGGGLSGLAEQLKQAYTAKLDATTDQGRIAADVTIKQLEERQSILLAEQKHFMTRMIRPLWAFLFIAYDAKILLWDKALHLGTTDQISADLWKIQMLIVTFYFVGRPFEKVMSRLKR